MARPASACKRRRRFDTAFLEHFGDYDADLIEMEHQLFEARTKLRKRSQNISEITLPGLFTKYCTIRRSYLGT
ncbi:hypothetical protein NHQ30_004098 [Ciborinia camelliae]|nr:hypothetical protein NHQ30_004098 [Ciborinia camelliae]